MDREIVVRWGQCGGDATEHALRVLTTRGHGGVVSHFAGVVRGARTSG